MSERTGDAGGNRPDDDAGRGASSGPAPRRRRPRWLLPGAGLLAILAVAAVVLVLSNRSAEPVEPPDAAVVTLPPPSPTIEPVDREPGTAFFDSLPSTVLAWALQDAGPHPALLADGAVEAYRLGYSDGTSGDLTVVAGQWADADAAAAAFEDRAAAATAAVGPADPDATAEPDAVQRQEGSVELDGEQVGEYLIVPKADGSGVAWWTNRSVLVEVRGPAESLDDFFAAFPL